MDLSLKPSPLKSILTFLLLMLNYFVAQGFTLKGCRISRNVAICSNSNLKDVPENIPNYVRGIDLSSNLISKLKLANLTHFLDLTQLDLKINKITNINKGTFPQLLSLTTLNLNSNLLEKLNNGIFDGLGKLENLLVGFNNIKTVEPDAFRSLKNLKTLVFSGNKVRAIVQIGLNMKHMPRLTELQLQHNSIQTFRSSDLANASTQLQRLDISENPLKLFQTTNNVFPNLTWLNVGNPNMKLTLTWDVPDKAALSNVATLDVSRVKMASSLKMWDLLSTFNASLVTLRMNAMRYNLAASIGKACEIPTVSELQIRQNNLPTIYSKLFATCTNIIDVDLSKNDVKEIDPGSFTAIPRLRILTLSNNKLQTVPNATRNLPFLNELRLNNNSIEILGCNDFANLTNLRQLSLQSNKIVALSDCVFQHVPKLLILELQGNAIKKINNAFHASLPNLKLLRLNQNSLTTIRAGEFRGLASLENLTLFQNHISKLEKRCFEGLNNLLDLQLQQNAIKRGSLADVFRDLVNLLNLNMGDNNIKYSDTVPMKNPPFLNLSKLTDLSLQTQRSRGKSKIPSNFLQGLTNLSSISFRNMQLTMIPDDAFIHTPNLDSLDLNSNDLMDLSPDLFSPIPNLTKLRISTINLHSLDFLIEANLDKLEFLQARKNSFSVIAGGVIKSMPGLRYLDLEYNSFHCDCNNAPFVKWIRDYNQTQVFDAYSFECYFPQHKKGTRLLDLDVQSCTIDIDFICFISTTTLTLLFLVASFTYHFMRFQLAYAYYVFLAWLFDRKNKNRQAPCQYDAFVSFNVHDEAWVYRELVPRLEKDQGWRLCLHHRDFEPGKPIVENITDAIYGSRKTLCVISRRYLQSEWCSREMQVASFRLFDESKDVLILVFLEDIPTCHLSPYYRMRKVLRRQTYLSWPGTGGETHVFWEKLRLALTTTKSAAEERLLLTVTDEQ